MVVNKRSENMYATQDGRKKRRDNTCESWREGASRIGERAAQFRSQGTPPPPQAASPLLPAAAAASVSHRTGGVGASKWKRGSRRGPVEQPTNIDHQLVVGGKKE